MGTMFYKDEPYGGGSKGNYLPITGGTMTGQIKTSFKNSIAMGSYEATANTIPDLINEVRYSSGCCGSANITTAYSGNPASLPAGWYNFLYIPHRSGGVNGAASGDNCNYGRLELFGMTADGEYEIRFAGSNIQYCKKMAFVSDLGSAIRIETSKMTGLSVGANVASAIAFTPGGISGYTTKIVFLAGTSNYSVVPAVLAATSSPWTLVVRNLTNSTQTFTATLIVVYVKS